MTPMGFWQLGITRMSAVLRLFLVQNDRVVERIIEVRLKPGKQVYLISNPTEPGRLVATLATTGVVDLARPPRYGFNYGG